MYAIRKLVAELKEELREARNLTKHDNSANDPAPRTPSIKIPDAPPPTNREDFPKDRFWSKTEWNKFETRAKNRNEQVDKLYFLCDESGRAISKAHRDEMTEVAKVAFNELYYCHQLIESFPVIYNMSRNTKKNLDSDIVDTYLHASRIFSTFLPYRPIFLYYQGDLILELVQYK